MDLCAALVLFACALFVLAALGHGLWVAVAAAFNALSGSSAASPPRLGPRGTCVRCGVHLLRSDSIGAACGLDDNEPLALELRELDVTLVTLRQLMGRGALDPLAGEQVVQALEARHMALVTSS